MFQTYVKAFQIGIIAGMRAAAAPALLSRKLARSIPTKEPQKPIHYFAQPPVSIGLAVLAGGEMIADKLPNAPNRTIPASVISRMASGATCGAFLSEVEGQPAPYGAVAGAVGALVGTLTFFNLRRWLDHDLGIPDTFGALAEDALVVGVGWKIVNNIEPKLVTDTTSNSENSLEAV